MIAALLSYLGPLLLAIFFFYFLDLSLLFKNRDGFPRNWPILGMSPSMLHHLYDMHNEIAKFANNCASTYLYKGIWFTNTDFLATADAENVRHVMSTKSSTYIKGSDWRKGFDIFGDALYNSDFEAWKHNRRIFHAFLNHQKFHQLVEKIIPIQIERGLIPVLKHAAKQGLVVDLQDLFVRYSFDLASIIVRGCNPESLSVGLPRVAFSKAMDDAWEAAFFRFILPESLWKLQRWLQIGREKKLCDACKVLDAIIAENISMQRQQLKSEDHHEDVDDGYNFLKCYLTGHQVTGPTPTDKLIRDNALHMMVAIEDTNSTVLTWFFWIISKNPSVLKKIREELTRSLLVKEEGELPLPLNLNETNKLVYLHAVLCETLRLFPPVPFEFRTATKSDILPSGHRVNEKMRVVICSHAMGRTRSIWGEDCHEFKPERWITAEGKIKREPPSKFFAFISGPRICLGKEFSFTLLKATAASIILNYNVEVIPGQNVTPKNSVLFQMKHGLMVKIKSIWN
ncbi:hypothetical protein SLA2020_113370 [Shorea laevis]